MLLASSPRRRGALLLCCVLLVCFTASFRHHGVQRQIPCTLTTLDGSNTRLLAADGPSDDADDAKNEKQMSDLFKLIVDAVNDGREEELAAAGLRVTKKSARETLDAKLSDPQIAENVLGSMTEEDKELARLLEVELQRQDRGGAAAGEALDPALFADLQAEARETLLSQRAAGSAVGALLGGASEFDDLLGSVFDDVMGDDDGADGDGVNWSSAGAGGVAQTLSFGEGDGGGVLGRPWDAFGPPAASPGSPLEVEEAADDDDVDDDGDGDAEVGDELDVPAASRPVTTADEPWLPQRPPSSRYYGLGQRPRYAAPQTPAASNAAPKRFYGLGKSPPSKYQYPPSNSASANVLFIAPKPPAPEPEPMPVPVRVRVPEPEPELPIAAEPSPMQAVRDPPAAAPAVVPASEASAAQETLFAQLLRATMEQQTAAIEAQADADGGAARGAVDAATAGDLGALDVKAILGEALSTLTDQLGIDVTAELQGNPRVIGEIQSMMAANMAELAKNMEELDQESQTLYDQLGTLEADLRKETAAFDDQKQLELGALLESQNALQSEFLQSKAKVEVSAAQLETMMRDLEDNADALTALALFPIKRPDKKVAFIVGLALLLKVPFDASQLVALHSSDVSDWLTVFTQLALCLTCLQHYGLVTALFKKSKTFGLPPPPPADL